MLEKIKILIRKAAWKIIYGDASTPESFIESLRARGIKIGDGTVFFDPQKSIVDVQNPKLLSIGDNVRFTSGIRILTHDFSWSVISGVYGDCIGGVAPVIIGNNVFIGVNTIILMGTHIGDNVIIGAGSVVSGYLDSNYIYAGNPARKIMTLDEFYKKRLQKNRDVIKEILRLIDDDEVWNYLREYSCQFKDSPEEVREGILHDSGYYEKCKRYYSDRRELNDLGEIMREIN